jgi:hypothetical protein
MKKMHAAVAALLAAFVAIPLQAQVTSTPPADAANAPTPAKKPAPKKDAPKKGAKKAPVKKDGKKAPLAKPVAPPPKSLELRDEKGNVIPISPDAYDISSATKPAPKKK